MTTGGGQATKTGGFTFVATPGRAPARPTAAAVWSSDRICRPVREQQYLPQLYDPGQPCGQVVRHHRASAQLLTRRPDERGELPVTATAANAGGTSAPSAQSSRRTDSPLCADGIRIARHNCDPGERYNNSRRSPRRRPAAACRCSRATTPAVTCGLRRTRLIGPPAG